MTPNVHEYCFPHEAETAFTLILKEGDWGKREFHIKIKANADIEGEYTHGCYSSHETTAVTEWTFTALVINDHGEKIREVTEVERAEISKYIEANILDAIEGEEGFRLTDSKVGEFPHIILD
jgi:hypothetical protein